MSPRESSSSWTLIFGTGERLATLRALLAPLAGESAVQALDDLERLEDTTEARGILVVDADRLAADDVVYIRRFSTRRDGFKIVLIGDDASRKVAREILRLDRARWIAWPPDVEHLLALSEPARTGTGHTASAPAATLAPRASGEVDEIAEIEAILGSTLGARAPRATRAPAADPHPSPPDLAVRPAPYFREQVADLADIAQRIELTLNVARETAEDAPRSDGESLAGLANEVERLMQFTRTLGYLVAPPVSGEQVFDVGEMLEVLIAGGAESPRYVLRREGPLFVRSDRQLLGQAFDAFLCVARSAGRGELVRIEVGRATDGDPSFGEVAIEFPAGALEGVEPARVIEPYALRRALPELGPNALAAAVGIIAGQGGRAELRPSTEGRLAWSIRLRSQARAESSVATAPGRKRGGDPFG